MFKALILAAGYGSRLGDITKNIPKALVPVNNKPIIYNQIECLLKNGINDITIVTGYMSDLLISEVKKRFPSVSFIVSKDYKTTNNMYSAYSAKNAVIGSPFIMMNADVFFDSSIISDLIKCENENAIAVDIGNYLDESMKVIEKNGVLTKISKEIKQDDSLGVSIDVYKFSENGGKEFFDKCSDYIDNKKQLKLWSEVALDAVLNEGKISFYSCPISGRWFEIDTIEDLSKAEALFV